MEVSAEATTEAPNVHAGIETQAGIDVSAEAHAHADNTGIAADVRVADVAEASVTVEGGVGTEDAALEGSATVFAKTGTEVEGHVEAGVHGVDVGAEASIGNAVGIEGEVTESMRYGSVTGGAGVSVGEHFEAGGSAEATFKHGVATVGVAGDVAALVGVDADVSASVDTKPIVTDAKVAAQEAVVAEKAVEQAVVSAGGAVESTAKKAVNSIASGAKKIFKKLKF